MRLRCTPNSKIREAQQWQLLPRHLSGLLPFFVLRRLSGANYHPRTVSHPSIKPFIVRLATRQLGMPLGLFLNIGSMRFAPWLKNTDERTANISSKVKIGRVQSIASWLA